MSHPDQRRHGTRTAGYLVGGVGTAAALTSGGFAYLFVQTNKELQTLRSSEARTLRSRAQEDELVKRRNRRLTFTYLATGTSLLGLGTAAVLLIRNSDDGTSQNPSDDTAVSEFDVSIEPDDSGVLLRIRGCKRTPGNWACTESVPEELHVWQQDDDIEWVMRADFGIVDSRDPSEYVCQNAYIDVGAHYLLAADHDRWLVSYADEGMDDGSRRLLRSADGCSFEVERTFEEDAGRAPEGWAVHAPSGQIAFFDNNGGDDQDAPRIFESDDGGSTFEALDLESDEGWAITGIDAVHAGALLLSASFGRSADGCSGSGPPEPSRWRPFPLVIGHREAVTRPARDSQTHRRSRHLLAKAARTWGQTRHGLADSKPPSPHAANY